MTTQTTIKCNHFFCILGGKKYQATVRVEQTWPNGHVKVTNCCPSDFEAYLPVINDPEGTCTYTVTEL